MKNQSFAPFQRIEKAKVTQIYRINTRKAISKKSDKWKPIWNFGRLEHLYEDAKDIFPKLLSESSKPVHVIDSFTPIDANAHICIFGRPNDRHVIFTLQVESGEKTKDIIKILDLLYAGQIEINHMPIRTYISESLESLGIESARPSKKDLQSNYHQIVELPKSLMGKNINKERIQRIAYRADLPARDDFLNIDYPNELNRRYSTVAAVSPFVTVIGGQQEYMSSAIKMAATTLVSVKQKSQEIREETQNIIKQMADNTDSDQRRAIVRLLELRYRTVSEIDSLKMIGVHVPAIRVESYHHSLWNQLSLDTITLATHELTEKSKEYVELVFIKKEEARAKKEETNKSTWTIIISLLSAAAIPPTIVFGYFGSEVIETGPNPSLLDFKNNLVIYSFVFGSVLASFLAGFSFKAIKTLRNSNDQQSVR